MARDLNTYRHIHSLNERQKVKEEKNLIEATQQEVETKSLASQLTGSPMSDENNNTNNFSKNKSQKEKDMKANADHENQLNPSMIENELQKSATPVVVEEETDPMFDEMQDPDLNYDSETEFEEDYDSEEDYSYSKPRSAVPSIRIHRGDAVKMARKQNIRQRKANKLKRLTNELKAAKDTIKRGSLMKVTKIEKVDENGNKSTKEVKTYHPIDSASKMLWMNKKIKIESEIFELKQTLSELKSEVKMKATNHLKASRLSLSQKKRDLRRMQTIQRYRNWLEIAAKNGSMATIKEASILQYQGRSGEALEKIMAVLLKYKLLKNPGAKSTLEFDEEIGKELLNYLKKTKMK